MLLPCFVHPHRLVLLAVFLVAPVSWIPNHYTVNTSAHAQSLNVAILVRYHQSMTPPCFTALGGTIRSTYSSFPTSTRRHPMASSMASRGVLQTNTTSTTCSITRTKGKDIDWPWWERRQMSCESGSPDEAAADFVLQESEGFELPVDVPAQTQAAGTDLTLQEEGRKVNLCSWTSVTDKTIPGFESLSHCST